MSEVNLTEEGNSLYSYFEKCRFAEYEEAENSASYAFQRDGDTLYILLEKSSGLTDWKNNLDFPTAEYKKLGHGWFCHRGFMKVWNTLEPIVASRISEPWIKNITVIGYSHGAAPAVFAHEFIWYNRPDLRDNLTGYGFGCPRVYWGVVIRKELRERRKNFYVIRNKPDIITHLPPVLFGYRHVGSTVSVGQYFKYSPIGAHRPENYETELNSLK